MIDMITVDSYFYIISVSLLILFVAVAYVLGFFRKRSSGLDKRLNAMTLNRRIPNKVKWWFMVLFTIPCLYIIYYCQTCKGGGPSTEDRTFFEWVAMTLLEIMPWFVVGCMLAGLVVTSLAKGWLKLPKSMLGAGAFASVIPICSCAAVPMAHGLMLSKQMRVRAVITFLIVVPVLSPIVMSLAWSQIGWKYLLVEIVAVFSLAMLTGILIERFAGVEDSTDGRVGCFSCKGCHTAHMHTGQTSWILAAWDQFAYLLKYILFGIIIGAGIARYVDPDIVSKIVGGESSFFSGLPSLVLITLLAIPIFICSGQDVVILAPLLAAGLPLGHAIAFAISGNAICLASAPVLNATFGKKVTILIFGAFFVGSILVGMVINGVVYAI